MMIINFILKALFGLLLVAFFIALTIAIFGKALADAEEKLIEEIERNEHNNDSN